MSTKGSVSPSSKSKKKKKRDGKREAPLKAPRPSVSSTPPPPTKSGGSLVWLVVLALVAAGVYFAWSQGMFGKWG